MGNERWVLHLYGPDDRWVRTPEGQAVVEVGYNRDEREADARLIAAAPEMLEALRDALGNLALYADTQPQAVIALVKVRAAIAKAEGK
jgi:hypothetical protein